MSARESMSAVLLVALRLLTDNQHQCQAATEGVGVDLTRACP